MRIRILGVSVVAMALLGSLGPSAVADPNRSFEATITAPAHDAGPELFADACPGPGEFHGVNYAFFDLKGEYKNFKGYGPEHLFNEPDPADVYHDINDYDIDVYAFDKKCKLVGSGETPGGTEKFETKRPARYAVVAYWSGIHMDLPVTLEVSHAKIK